MENNNNFSTEDKDRDRHRCINKKKKHTTSNKHTNVLILQQYLFVSEELIVYNVISVRIYNLVWVTRATHVSTL